MARERAGLLPESVLIVGGDGRAHAMGSSIGRFNPHTEIFYAPGNGGTEPLGINTRYGVDDIDGIAKFAYDNKIGLTIVSPEAPLDAGIVNMFKTPIFGPTAEATKIEADKAWAIKMMESAGVPHPKSWEFTDADATMRKVLSMGWENSVIKAAGLAAGKGVIVPESADEALQAVLDLLDRKKLGPAGEKVVIQQRISGPELSVMAFVDRNQTICYLPVSRDAKRAFDGDKGPNTGGMGAYAPVPFEDASSMQTIHNEIFQPMVAAMAKNGTPFVGKLYGGLMMTKSGPKVIEFNARGGDPETEPQELLWNENPLAIYMATVAGRLPNRALMFRPGAAVAVVLASEGYPGKYQTGKLITGIEEAMALPDVMVFHAGTKRGDITSGGRVIVPTAYGADLTEARARAYQAADIIKFENKQYRKDIAAVV